MENKEDKIKDNDLERIWSGYNSLIKKQNKMEQIEEIIKAKSKKEYRYVSWSAKYGTLFLLPLILIVLVNTMVYRPVIDFWVGAGLVFFLYLYVAYLIITEFIVIRKINYGQDTLLETMKKINRIYYKRMEVRTRLYWIFPFMCIGVYLWGHADLFSIEVMSKLGVLLVIFYMISRHGFNQTKEKMERLKRDMSALEDLEKKDTFNSCE